MQVQSRFDSNKIGELVCDGAMKFVNNFAVEINGERVAEYKSLDAVAKDWEDYKPAEPLIKDGEIRKAVIAWANANSQRTAVAYKQLDETISIMSFIDFGGLIIEFNKLIDGLESGKIYGFTELCGEEK